MPQLTALVTGASSGIGVHYARELVRKGYNVILISNQMQQIRETAACLAAEASCADRSEEPAPGTGTETAPAPAPEKAALAVPRINTASGTFREHTENTVIMERRKEGVSGADRENLAALRNRSLQEHPAKKEPVSATGCIKRIAANISPETDRPQGQWVMGIYKDLAAPRAAKELWDFCQKRNICVDLLINNAGIFIFQDTADSPPEKIVLLLNLHIQTVTLLCRYFGKAMKERGRGYILNMSSISAHTPFPGISLYTGSKSYIRTFTRALHDEMKEYGVKVMAVSPGAVATDLYNLPPDLQKLGVRLGIIYRPGKLARKALEKLMRGKTEYVPGILNRFFKPIYSLLPGCLIIKIRQKLKPLMR